MIFLRVGFVVARGARDGRGDEADGATRAAAEGLGGASAPTSREGPREG